MNMCKDIHFNLSPQYYFTDEEDVNVCRYRYEGRDVSVCRYRDEGRDVSVCWYRGEEGMGAYAGIEMKDGM